MIDLRSNLRNNRLIKPSSKRRILQIRQPVIDMNLVHYVLFLNHNQLIVLQLLFEELPVTISNLNVWVMFQRSKSVQIMLITQKILDQRRLRRIEEELVNIENLGHLRLVTSILFEVDEDFAEAFDKVLRA